MEVVRSSVGEWSVEAGTDGLRLWAADGAGDDREVDLDGNAVAALAAFASEVERLRAMLDERADVLRQCMGRDPWLDAKIHNALHAG